jgi:hypothetical protein
MGCLQFSTRLDQLSDLWLRYRVQSVLADRHRHVLMHAVLRGKGPLAINEAEDQGV